MKRIVKLRESELRRMIAESVKRVLNEDQHFNSEGFITQTNGLDTFYGVYDEWMPNIESWEEAGDNYSDFHNAMEIICSEYAKNGYTKTANVIKQLMDNIDGVMGEFGKVRETFDYEYFKKSNNGMDYGDYLNSKGKANYGG